MMLFCLAKNKHKFSFSRRIVSILFSTSSYVYHPTLIQFAGSISSAQALQPSSFGKLQATTSSRSFATSSNHSETSSPTTATMSTNNSNNTLNFWENGRSLALDHAIVPLTYDSHKGSYGRIGVLGGSGDYTGAPFYAAMASLNAGADLSFVFCANEAAIPIKSYSPELMVTPVYSVEDFDRAAQANHSAENDKRKRELIQTMVDKVKPKLERLHVLIVGPGLGRCPVVCEAVARIMEYARSKELPMVLDADALWMLAQPQYRTLLDGYKNVVLTPNVVEYKRLIADENESCQNKGEDNNNNPFREAIIVRKGRMDSIIKNNTEIFSCQETGGMKRSGGIGDVLSGTLGTLVAWNNILSKSNNEKGVSGIDYLALSCWTACCFVKRATKLAFDKKRRSMTAPDVLENLGVAIEEMTSENGSSRL